MATAEAQPRPKSGRVRIRDRLIHLIRPSPENERLTTTTTTNARSDSPTGELDRFTIRHAGHRRSLTVDVHLTDGQTLRVETHATQLQSCHKLRSLVGDALGVRPSWDGERERLRVARDEWAETVKDGFQAGGRQ